ncbi:MAG: MBL fold metallo-hydrolase [Thermodesulfovibrionales bacterium]|nr:MBL fold metallo-hydrolase [Thermodesulfovibrionales bacterium]
MRQTFHATYTLNPFDDPFLFIRILRERKALLFDVGHISSLEPGNLLKVTDVFVTHTHIDHFIGFDMILRLVLRREMPLRIYGPEGIIGCIEGKLNGYTWNLIRDYPLKIEVFEIKNSNIYHSSFHAENQFKRADNESWEFKGVLYKDTLYTVRGLQLTHQIPVLAFSLLEDYHININKEKLSEIGLSVGPWLSDFKRSLRINYDMESGSLLQDDVTFEVKGRLYSLAQLLPIAIITKGQKISYVMDVSPTEENFERLKEFIRDSDYLFCEGYFLERDRQRAIERHHLTAADAGRLAREAGVKNLILIHFSPKYINCPQDLYDEAMKEFKK